MTSVKCTVDECQFWEEDICQADAIEVSTVYEHQDDGDLEIGDMGASGKAYSSEDTMCITFIPGEEED